jgi:histidinol-phosphatase (PHP family)
MTLALVPADLHNHTTWCDGRSTAFEMAAAAYERGFSDFGFSGHSNVAFDQPCSVRDMAGYIADIRSLQQSYAGRMRIYCGVEQDYCGPVADRSLYDYLIGAVHYLPNESDGSYFAVDGQPESLAEGIDAGFGGDAYAMCRAYFELVVKNASSYRPDIVAHFDLVVRNNSGGRFFDEQDRRYQSAALTALTALRQQEQVLELNSGGIYRGFRATPYPAEFLLQEWQRSGGRITLSADAHETQAVGFRFAEGLDLLRSVGFRSLLVWQDGAFREQGL